MPKPAAYADVFAHTLSLCFITVFHSSRLADLQGLEICRLWVLFHCFEMHVYTCIYLAHCMHFAVINLFFFFDLLGTASFLVRMSSASIICSTITSLMMR